MFAIARFRKVVDGTPFVVNAFIDSLGPRSMYATVLFIMASLSLLTNLQIVRLEVSSTGFRYLSSALLFLTFMYVGSLPSMSLYISLSA